VMQRMYPAECVRPGAQCWTSLLHALLHTEYGHERHQSRLHQNHIFIQYNILKGYLLLFGKLGRITVVVVANFVFWNRLAQSPGSERYRYVSEIAGLHFQFCQPGNICLRHKCGGGICIGQLPHRHLLRQGITIGLWTEALRRHSTARKILVKTTPYLKLGGAHNFPVNRRGRDDETGVSRSLCQQLVFY